MQALRRRAVAARWFRLAAERRFSSIVDEDFEALSLKKAPNSFWDPIETRRKFLDWSGAKLRVRSLSDWYGISRSSIKQLGGGGLLALHYNDSLPGALQALYPDHEWLPWRFKYIPKGFWSKRENRVLFFKWSASQLGMKPGDYDSWYSIKRSQVEDLGGESLLVNYYGHSLPAALADIFPDHAWDALKFSGSSSPRSIEEISRVLDEFAHKLQVKCLEDWYRVSSRQWKGHRIALIIRRYGGLPAVLKTVFPDHKWQLSSFSTLGKKAMQFKLRSTIAELFPKSMIEEDVHTARISSWRTTRHLEFDIYLPEYNLAFEYQGEQHFQTIATSMRSQAHWEQADAEKMALCRRYGITLIEVPYNSWDGSTGSIRDLIVASRPDLQPTMAQAPSKS